eukprot:480878_1
MDLKQIILSSEYNHKLSANNFQTVIDFYFRQYFNHIQMCKDITFLLISFFGGMDGKLLLKEYEVYRIKNDCSNVNDYYEYDSIYLSKFSRLILTNGKLLCIKCFGDLVIDENADISVSNRCDLTINDIDIFKYKPLIFGVKGNRPINWKPGAKGGGIIKIICFGNVIIRKNGLIQANGGDGGTHVKYGGGGTIYIKCNKLINHGKIIAIGSNITEPEWRYVYANNRSQWAWGSTSGFGPNGKIIIDGEYSEDGYKFIGVGHLYCGPILLPEQQHLKHYSINAISYQ